MNTCFLTTCVQGVGLDNTWGSMWIITFSCETAFGLRSGTPAFLSTMEVEAPWKEEPVFMQLMHDLSRPASFHKIDLFHTISLGVGKSFSASAICVLQVLVPGSSIDERLGNVSSSYIEFCKDYWQHLIAFKVVFSFQNA